MNDIIKKMQLARVVYTADSFHAPNFLRIRNAARTDGTGGSADIPARPVRLDLVNIVGWETQTLAPKIIIQIRKGEVELAFFLSFLLTELFFSVLLGT